MVEVIFKNKYMTFSFLQILGVTADNASNNDKMIEHLAVLIETFPGATNQTRCFAHILNLVAKTVLRQFEAPKKGKAIDGKELAAVVDEIDDDNEGASDSGTIEGGDDCDDVDDEVVDDDEDGLPDELEELSEEELSRVKESVKPIRLVLTKVSPFNKHQSTINKHPTASRFLPGYQKLVYDCPS
jgi:hypothetical protein